MRPPAGVVVGGVNVVRGAGSQEYMGNGALPRLGVRPDG